MVDSSNDYVVCPGCEEAVRKIDSMPCPSCNRCVYCGCEYNDKKSKWNCECADDPPANIEWLKALVIPQDLVDREIRRMNIRQRFSGIRAGAVVLTLFAVLLFICNDLDDASRLAWVVKILLSFLVFFLSYAVINFVFRKIEDRYLNAEENSLEID